MGDRRVGRLAGLAALGLVALVIPACSGVPTGTPVVSATVNEFDDDATVEVGARPPQPGATPSQIVEGYLEAMSEPEYPLAELFMTPAARDDWEPEAVEVYTRTTTETTQPSLVRLLYDRVARIDDAGRYTAQAKAESATYPLRLEQDEDGEWRIADPPVTLLISSLDLSTLYSPFTTYFPDPGGEVLVPDQVWLPTEEEQLALRLAQAVVDGPTVLLQSQETGGVLNAFPVETRVSATINGSVLAVALTGPNLEAADDAARRLMVAQLSATIRLPGVDRVDVTINSEPVDVPDITRQLDVLADFGSPPVYMLNANNALLSAEPDPASAFTQVPGSLGRGELAARSFAVSLDRTTAATVDPTGSQVSRGALTDSGAPRAVYIGRDVAPPSFDRFGNLWLVDRVDDTTSEVKIVEPDGSSIAVAAPDLSGEKVSHLRVAPDGVRIAVVSEVSGAPLQLGHVIRGEAPAIDLTVEVPFEGTVLDAAWAGETELLVLVRLSSDGLARPFSVSVDGSTVIPSSQTGVTAVAAYATRPAAYALTDVDSVLRQTSVLRWDRVAAGTFVTYPG